MKRYALQMVLGFAAVAVVLVGLEVPRDVLDDRITRRVDAMFDAGVLFTIVKLPAMISFCGSGPAPSGSQTVIAFTEPSTPGTPKPGNHCPSQP